MSNTWGVGDFISFRYTKSHPNKDRLLYITEHDGFMTKGLELEDNGTYDDGTYKKFFTSNMVNVKQIGGAKLPVQAIDYAEEIFAKMLGVSEEDLKIFEVRHVGLIGVVSPKIKPLLARVSTDHIARTVHLNDVTLYIHGGYIYFEHPNQLKNGHKGVTKESLVKYLSDNL